MSRTEPPLELQDAEPRWPAFVAILAAGGLYAALPEVLTMGPRWLFPSVVLALLIPNIVSHHTGSHRLNTLVGFTVDAVLTAGLIIALGLLVTALPTQKVTPIALLLAAASLWVTNILVFALWYWRLDAGGPHQRDKRAAHSEGAFLFPQMTMSKEALRQTGQRRWSPNFVDYLFLAFNTQHGIFSHRRAGVGALGKSPDDDAVAALAAHHRAVSRARREYFISGRP